MGTIEDIIKMRNEGISDSQIEESLKKQGFSSEIINQSIIQANIKEAVTDRQTEGIKKEQNTNNMKEEEKIKKVMGNTTETSEDQYEGMQQSMMQPRVEEAPASQQEQQYYPQQDNQQQAAPSPQYGETQQYDYGQYQSYQPSGLSSDTITEISQQIVDEKMISVKNQMEKVIDFKNTTESKIDSLDERLKKIEKIIDRLQLSILQKVGEYSTNIEDIKKEMVETQKSFKSLLPQAKQGLHEKHNSQK